ALGFGYGYGDERARGALDFDAGGELRRAPGEERLALGRAVPAVPAHAVEPGDRARRGKDVDDLLEPGQVHRHLDGPGTPDRRLDLRAEVCERGAEVCRL